MIGFLWSTVDYLASVVALMMLVLPLPWFWCSAAGTVGAALWMDAFPPSSQRDGGRIDFLVPFVFPVAIVFWAGTHLGALEKVAPGFQWQELGVYGPLALQAVASVWLLKRQQQRAHIALGVSLLAAWLAAAVAAWGLMALANDFV
jgi:hypothetical protein